MSADSTRLASRTTTVLALLAAHGLVLGVFWRVAAPLPAEPDPAVPIRRSVNPEYIACLECGAKATLLRPHLANAHNLMPADYRERWNLPSDYPMVAPRYAARRSEWARAAGLGRKHGKGGEASKRASRR